MIKLIVILNKNKISFMRTRIFLHNNLITNLILLSSNINLCTVVQCVQILVIIILLVFWINSCIIVQFSEILKIFSDVKLLIIDINLLYYNVSKIKLYSTLQQFARLQKLSLNWTLSVPEWNLAFIFVCFLYSSYLYFSTL